MKDIQHVFNEIKKAQTEQKFIRQIYSDVRAGSEKYQALLEELKKMRETKKNMEIEFKSELRAEFDKLDELKIDIESNRELLSDLAFNTIIKGDTISITDEYDNKYEPRFSVKFKKI